MITEKTAQAREAAVLHAVEPKFKKIQSALDYLTQVTDNGQQKNEIWRKSIDNRSDLQEIQILENIQEQENLKQSLNEKSAAMNQSIHQMQKQNDEILRSMYIKCSQCGKFIAPIQMICHNCGAFSDIFPYEIKNGNEYVQNDCYNQILPLSEKLQNVAVQPFHYSSMQSQYDQLIKIKLIAENYIESYPDKTSKDIYIHILRDVNKAIQAMNNKHIEIAVVGSVKAGKSSLINALLGANMASVDATPETSVLVKYRTSKKNFIRVYFYTDLAWEKLWNSAKSNEVFSRQFTKLNADKIKENFLGAKAQYTEYDSIEELQKAILTWTSSASPEHFFAREVEIGLCSNTLPRDVVLVDTPGLLDAVKFRSDITKKYIRKANYVLACIPKDSTTNVTAFDFLNKVRANLQHDSNRMIIVHTQIDLLRKKDCERLRDQFIEQIAKFYGDNIGKASDHFISISALMYTFINEFLEGNLTDTESIIELKGFCEKRGITLNEISTYKNELCRETGIPLLIEKLDEKVFKKTREEIFEMLEKDFQTATDRIRSRINEQRPLMASQLLDLQDDTDKYYVELESMQKDIKKQNEELTNLQRQLADIQKKVNAEIKTEDN